MCGIVGIFGQRINHSLFQNMLYVNVYRGADSTGVASITKDGTVRRVHSLGQPWDLVEDKVYEEEIIAYKKENICLIGHNRAATKGSVSFANVHPFHHGNIVLVHNGTVFNDHALKLDRHFQTDSEKICYALDRKGVEWTWSRVEGGTCLVWWNIANQTLNFLKNEGRPLSLAYTSAGLVFASEPFVIRALCAMYKIKIYEVDKLDIRSPLSNYHLSFKLDTLPAFEQKYIQPFKFEPVQQQKTSWFTQTPKALPAPIVNNGIPNLSELRTKKMGYKQFFEFFKECMMCNNVFNVSPEEFKDSIVVDRDKAMCATCVNDASNNGWLKWVV